MSKWIYDGYTKIKTGSGRHAKYIEKHIYKCHDCGWSIRADRTELYMPKHCPNCQKDMWDGEG